MDEKVTYKCPENKSHCKFRKNCTALILPAPLTQPFPMYIKCPARHEEHLFIIQPENKAA
ncbi:hypothetical protein [Bilifractor sp. HCP3S3_D3]|jgi:hypothetical protein|uniref:hypothetical protein n=1 Tax=Bilifractor sp. HCP3S3_D3 TaxID=3438907 RepID=UPI003F89EB98